MARLAERRTLPIQCHTAAPFAEPPTLAMRRVPLLLFLLLSLVTMPLFSETLKSDERVQFVRGLAHVTTDGVVEAEVTAWVHEHEQRPGAKTLFAKLTGIDLASLTADEAARFEQRTQLFRYDAERGKRLRLLFAGDQSRILPVTDSDGISRDRVRFGPVDQLSLQHAADAPPLLRFRVALEQDDPRLFEGELVLVPPQGLSIVSDIDDTIKRSQVRDRNELIRNTFVREFKPVPGMADWYQAHAAANDSTRFHYLSSSPHQLWPALDAFLQDSHFPIGSVHLRQIKLLDELLGNGDSSRQHKLGSLHQLLQQFSQRQFVLVGDSGEADPEIYAEIARAYPAQVVGIYIRDVTGEAADTPRYQQTFAGLTQPWQIFSDPADLPIPKR